MAASSLPLFAMEMNTSVPSTIIKSKFSSKVSKIAVYGVGVRGLSYALHPSEFMRWFVSAFLGDFRSAVEAVAVFTHLQNVEFLSQT